MKKGVIIAFLLFFISFGIYLKTLCPTVYVGDSGELIAAAYTLGIPHPPGYPLYCLLGKLFTFLPFGSIAYRVNLMSAFFASLTVVLVYLIILKILTNGPTGQQANGTTGKLANWQTGKPFTSHIPAISASLLFAFSLAFWSQAVVAEVYTLNAFFVALSLLLLVLWGQGGKKKHLYWLAFIYGLSLTNHYSMLLLAPGLTLYIFYTKRNILKEKKTISGMLSLGLLGLILYAYLPLRSLANPPIDWGNPENLSNFLMHITREQYGEIGAPSTITFFLKQLFYSAKFLVQQLPVYIELLGLIGLSILFKKDRRWFYATLLLFLFSAGGATYFLNFRSEIKAFAFGPKFYIPCYIILIIWIGYGIEYLLKRGEEVNRRINFGGKSIYRYVASLLILSLPLLPLRTNYFNNDRSRHYIAYDYGINILGTLDEDAILFTEGDNPTFALAYLTLIEKKRPDVTIYDRNGYLFPDIYGFARLRRLRLPGRNLIKLPKEKKDMMRTRADKRIITTSGRPVYYMAWREMDKMSGYTLEQAGIVYRVSKEGEVPSKEEIGVWRDYNLRGLDEEIFKDYMSREIIAQYHYHLGKYYKQIGEPEKAILEYEKASRIGWDVEAIHYNLGRIYYRRGWPDKAIEEYERVVELDSGSVMAHNNLGASYAQKGWHQKARSEWKKALEIDPKNEEAQRNLERLINMGTNK